MPEYAFDIKLNTTARTCADTEDQARRNLTALDWEFQIGSRTDRENGRVWLTDASMAHDAAQARLVGPRAEAEPAGPLYRAGSGAYEAVSAPINQNGWDVYEDASGNNCTWISPDRELSVEFGPEADAPRVAPLWRVTYRNPDPYRTRETSFAAYFDGNVPAEAVAAFIAALAAPSPRPTTSNNEEH